jgi:hypothetical protein
MTAVDEGGAAQHKVLFLHVPKTGGTYLSAREAGQPVLSGMRYLNHAYVICHPGELNPLYVHTRPELARSKVILRHRIRAPLFSVVRNIFDILVSYAGHAGGWNPKYANPGHYDFAPANRGFEYLLQTIANREDLWPNRRFIFQQLFDSGGGLVADRILRNETLDDDVAAMALGLNLAYRRQARARVGVRADYRSYYNDKLIRLVAETWGRELRLFGYDFDNTEAAAATAVLPRNVDARLKAEVRYYLGSDALTIAGAPVQ